MRRQSIASSHLKSVGYDPDTETLEVEFRTGPIYVYQKVPVDLIDRLLSSDSPGAFFNREIRNRFEYRKLRGHK